MTLQANVLSNCRICRSDLLEDIFDFGNLALTGIFEKNGLDVAREPMCLMRCQECGLVQLRHSYLLSDLYGDSYGYESHLNNSMRAHLQNKAQWLEKLFKDLHPNVDLDLVVDIASNDGTFLNGYSENVKSRVGVDPLISKFKDFYPKNALKIESFFGREVISNSSLPPVQIVTSNSVLYDIEDPLLFASEIFEILSEGGIWHLEQSYLVSMVKALSFDTICQEHLLYLSAHDLVRILKQTGFQILNVELNDINGGSIALTAIKSMKTIEKPQILEDLLKVEIDEGYIDGSALHEFSTKIKNHIQEIDASLQNFQRMGFKLFGLGASTKGNVLLQSLSYTGYNLLAIGDINPRKFGKETPGTAIKIIPETDILDKSGENCLCIVLPWHFHKGITMRSELFLKSGGLLLIPFPEIKIVSGDNFEEAIQS